MNRSLLYDAALVRLYSYQPLTMPMRHYLTTGPLAAVQSERAKLLLAGRKPH